MDCPKCETENVELVEQSGTDEEPDAYKCCECGTSFKT